MYGPPTGKRVRLNGISHHRIWRSQFVEEWTEVGAFGLLREIAERPSIVCGRNRFALKTPNLKSTLEEQIRSNHSTLLENKMNNTDLKSTPEEIMRPLPVIGFIGAGRMGLPMIANLLRAGFTVHAYDILAERVALVSALGAVPASSIAAATAEADIVISMIMDDTVLETVALGEDGVLNAASPDTLFVDMSTVSPVVSQKVAAVASDRGIAYLRAKVSGSIKPAEDGALTIFASGSRHAYDACYKGF